MGRGSYYGMGGLRENAQLFVAGGNYTPPAWVAEKGVIYEVHLLAAGGGAGGGARVASGTACSGGGGGAGGSYSYFTGPGSDVAPSGCTIVIGAGGVGGAARTTNDQNGADATQGGDTNALDFLNGGIDLRAKGGGAGQGGRINATSNGGGSNGAATNGGSNGLGGPNGGQGNGSAGNFTGKAGIGGPSGGGISTTPAAFNGNTGGYHAGTDTTARGTTGTTAGVLPGSLLIEHGLSIYGLLLRAYAANGSGASSITGAAQDGPDAASWQYAAGGAGGGSSLNGNNSGKGGNGGPGAALIIIRG